MFMKEERKESSLDMIGSNMLEIDRIHKMLSSDDPEMQSLGIADVCGTHFNFSHKDTHEQKVNYCKSYINSQAYALGILVGQFYEKDPKRHPNGAKNE